MKTKKSGAPVVPRFVWKLLADTELAFGRELLDELQRVEPEIESALAKALLKIAARHVDRMETFDSLSEETRRGRPRKIEKHPNALAAGVGIPAPSRAAGKPGRPAKRGPAFDLQTYAIVERRRQSLAEGRRTRPTIKAAIDSVNEEVARALGKRELAFVSAEYASVRASYERGKRATAKFQNPG